MRLFGPTHEDIWKLFSEDIGAKFVVDDSFFIKKYEVIKEFHNWIIVLDMVSGSRREPAYTRAYCKFLNKQGFKFKIFGQVFNNYFPNFFDMLDIKVPYNDFSDKFIIRSNSEVAIKTFLGNSIIRELINMQPDMLLEIKKQESYEITENADSIFSVKIPGIIKNNEVLKNLFELVGEGLLEIENICIGMENLKVNNFTRFDIIKNSVKNTLLENVEYKKIKNDIINNASKVIDKASHYYSHEKSQVSVSKVVSENITNENDNKDVSYTENSNTEIKDKNSANYWDKES